MRSWWTPTTPAKEKSRMAGHDAFPPSADGPAAGSRAGTGLRPRLGRFGLAWKGPGARTSGRDDLRCPPAGAGRLRPGWDGGMRAASCGGMDSGLAGGLPGGGRRRFDGEAWLVWGFRPGAGCVRGREDPSRGHRDAATCGVLRWGVVGCVRVGMGRWGRRPAAVWIPVWPGVCRAGAVGGGFMAVRGWCGGFALGAGCVRGRGGSGTFGRVRGRGRRGAMTCGVLRWGVVGCVRVGAGR